MSFDWRKEFERQHGYRPGAAINTEAPTATAGSGHQPAPAKASDQPAAEATAGGATVNPSGPAEIIREEGESGAPNFERVEIAPNQFVNLRTAEKLGLVRKAGG